jgi:hypothetical protein
MNQLSSIVLDFARFHRADSSARGVTALDHGGDRHQAGLLTRHWLRDPASGRLICAWTAQKGAREAQPPSQRSLTG